VKRSGSSNYETTAKQKVKIFQISYVDSEKKKFVHILAGLWIRIRIGSGFRDFVDPDPHWESGSGSRGKKTKKFQWKKCTFLLLNNKNFTTEKL
jgi:hypothetical protein